MFSVSGFGLVSGEYYPLILPDVEIVLWLNANFRTGFQKQKFGEKLRTFDLLNAKK